MDPQLASMLHRSTSLHQSTAVTPCPQASISERKLIQEDVRGRNATPVTEVDLGSQLLLLFHLQNPPWIPFALSCCLSWGLVLIWWCDPHLHPEVFQLPVNRCLRQGCWMPQLQWDKQWDTQVEYLGSTYVLYCSRVPSLLLVILLPCHKDDSKWPVTHLKQ